MAHPYMENVCCNKQYVEAKLYPWQWFLIGGDFASRGTRDNAWRMSGDQNWKDATGT